MKEKAKTDKTDRRRLYRALIIVTAVFVNVLLGWLINKAGLPLYLDSMGTVFVTAFCGFIPGVIVAVATNIFSVFYNPDSMYYTLVGVLIVLAVEWCARSGRSRKKSNAVFLIFLLSLIGGVVGIIFQWLLLGGPQFTDVANGAGIITGGNTALYFPVCLLLNVCLNFVDKAITTVPALFLIKLFPSEFRDYISGGNWVQRPLTEEEKEVIRKGERGRRHSIRFRLTMMLTLACVAVAVVMALISINLYYEDTEAQYQGNALQAAKFAASVLDPDKIDMYLAKGWDVAGYGETRELLTHIRDGAPGVKYLYVVKIKKDGCYWVFDLDSDDAEAYEPGSKSEFEEAFYPYLPALQAGEEIDPIESDDVSGWVLTTYYPVKNEMGKTVCYVGVDVSMTYLSGYMVRFALRTILVFSGFFVLILGCGLKISGTYLVYPVGSMANSIEDFSGLEEEAEQKVLDANAARLKKLEITTDDEVETLYRAICGMAETTADQVRSIRHFADATAKMQNGLIITMADLVENRDSDTGAHIQKTAAYVRIIAESLRSKGYYTDKLTDKFISDAVMSAPLHDVGKINIPDAVLNKPGKLTPEEYEIMKTHTIAGREIMEKAISTVNGENYLKEARNMAGYHHERWDGKGYPEGLKGEVIPLSARIMSVADVFDALASPRVYKPAFPLDKALSIIQEGAGTQFDPYVVEAFMDALPEVKQVLSKYQEA